jgi:DinB superfamily
VPGVARSGGSVDGVTITPDSKDWTWVLRQPCPECGFDTSSFARGDVGALLRTNVVEWQRALTDVEAVRIRPRPDVWSPLEYACHVRDVFRIFEVRLNLMLTQDDPLFANWDQDETAIAEQYGHQDPAEVGVELAESGDRLADEFDAVSGDQWDRTGRRSDGANFTVETFARYFIHDPVHHLYDVTG